MFVQKKKYWILIFAVFALLQCKAFFLNAAEPVPYELQGIGIDEKLGATLDLNTPFLDEKGEKKELKAFFDGKRPVIVTLVYYECPNLCGLLLKGFLDSLKTFPWSVGEQFDVVTLSIDPKEGPELAAAKKKNILEIYTRPSAEKGWHFLTGSEADVRKVASTLGFNYRYDAEEKQYAHAAGIFILTPEGKLSRVLYGISFSLRDLKLALLEASQGKIGTVVDRLLMFCYHYDPKGRKYALLAVNLMKVAGAVTIFGLVIFLSVSLIKNKKRFRS